MLRIVSALIVLLLLAGCHGQRPAKPLKENVRSVIMLRHPVIRAQKVNSLKRNSMANVIPVEEDCKSPTFLAELKELRKKIKCKPRPVVVHLQSTSRTTLIPNAVIVNRCDGMCTGTHKCISTASKDTVFYVREIKNNKVSCTSVLVTEDTQCKCDCPQKATDCNSLIQDYDTESCRCICKNELEYGKCMDLKVKRDFYWNPQKCACMCKERICTTGSVWKPDLCRCVRVGNQKIRKRTSQLNGET